MCYYYTLSSANYLSFSILTIGEEWLPRNYNRIGDIFKFRVELSEEPIGQSLKSPDAYPGRMRLFKDSTP